jgi:hypothetical protein
MEVGFRNSRGEQNFKAGGGGFSRKLEDQLDTLLLAWFQATDNRLARSAGTFPSFNFLYFKT